MRSQRAPLFKLGACLAVVGFLFGVGAASAVERDGRVSKDPQQIQKPFHFKSFGTFARGLRPIGYERSAGLQ